MKYDFKKDIRHIIKEFPFDKVEKCMTFLGWTYYDGKPNRSKLISIAKNLLKMASENDEEYFYIGTGGFTATKYGSHLNLTWGFEESNEIFHYEENSIQV